MKGRISLAVLTFVLTAVAAKAESCSCNAPDGSCSASISCSGGCVAICGSGGSCTAQCSGSSGGPRQPFQKNSLVLPETPGEPFTSKALPTSAAAKTMNVDLQSATADEISAQLTALAKVPIHFVPTPREETLSIQLKGFPLDEFLAVLAKRGAVVIDGRNYEGGPAKAQAGNLERRVTLEAHQVDDAELSQLLSGILGQTILVRARVPHSLFNFQAKDMSIEELLTYVAAVGDVSKD